jgi:hypothetical protein
MCTTIQSYDEQQSIVSTKMDGNISSNDLRTTFGNVQQLLQMRNRRVDILFDIHASRMPGNFLSILATFINQTSDNAGNIVLIGDNTYISSLAMAFWRVYPFESQRIKLVASIEEAILLIARERNIQT